MYLFISFIDSLHLNTYFYKPPPPYLELPVTLDVTAIILIALVKTQIKFLPVLDYEWNHRLPAHDNTDSLQFSSRNGACPLLS